MTSTDWELQNALATMRNKLMQLEDRIEVLEHTTQRGNVR